MKQTTILILLAAILAGSCNTKSNEVIITGKVEGQGPFKIFYNDPIRGGCDLFMKESLLTDSMGNFRLSYNLDQPSFLTLEVQDKTNFENYPTIVLEPGKKYEVLFNVQNKEAQYKVSCSNNELQEYYDSLSKIPPATCVYKYEKDFGEMSALKVILTNKLNEELKGLDELIAKGLIGEETYGLIKLDREVYYGTALSVVASMNRLRLLREKKLTPDSIFTYWKEGISLVNLEDKSILRTKNLYDFLDMYYWYQVYANITYPKFNEARMKFKEQDLDNTYKLDIAEEIIPEKFLELFKSRYLFIYSQIGSGEEIVSLISEFKVEYPNSSYIQHLEPIEAKLKNSNKYFKTSD